jgi:hypothetical protein
MPNITFRPDDDRVNEQLAALAQDHGRPIASELRAAVYIYLGLQDLVRLREQVSRGLTADQREDLERRIKDDIGRVLLAAISQDAHSLFEDATGVEYPQNRIGHIPIHFEKLIDWVVTGLPQAS